MGLFVGLLITVVAQLSSGEFTDPLSEEKYLIAPHVEFTDPHCQGKQVIVHLFEWKWTDVATECERFLSKKGYCAVQVSPPNEHVMVTKEYQRPWWERKHTVSYKLHSRGGTEDQFKDMVTRCKNVGVRIIVDVVMNHMAGMGRNGTGTAGSSFNSDYLDFPGVPFNREHFNDKNKCPSGGGMVNNYGDPNNVRNCSLMGLTDLNQNLEYVRDEIAGYLNNLIDIGVSGFRIGAAINMWPADISAIQKRVKNLPEGGKAFWVHEVTNHHDGAIKVGEYSPLGYVTEFRYCHKIAVGTHNFGALGRVVDHGRGMTPSANAFVFVDNHETQRYNGSSYISYKTTRDYKFAQAFTLAYNYGFVRVMSSYFFGNDTDQGPSHNADFSAKDVTIKADGTCGNGWVCEHRWAPIANMAAFRNAVVGTDIKHWYDQGDVVAFARGNTGFFVMAKQGHLDQTFQTGLPAGDYCDLIHDCQQKVTVDGSGNAKVHIDNQEEPILAIIVGGPTSPTGNNGDGVTMVPSGTTPDMTSWSWRHTVILIERRTNGQDLFFRGGLDHSHKTGCNSSASASNPCSIPIRHRDHGHGPHYNVFNMWSTGDNFLDWYGAEPGQGSVGGRAAEGTPAVWTTNKSNRAEYSKYNTYGDHYWMVDFDMDCSKTENGFFEFKSLVNGTWEGNIFGGACTGVGAVKPPFDSMDHIARCGYLNVFHWEAGKCEVMPLV